MIQRGLAHPVLGPLVLILLALLLSMVFLHMLEDGHGALGEFGAACVALASMLGVLLIARGQGLFGSTVAQARGDRGPPVTVLGRVTSGTVTTLSTRSSPLRR